MSAGDFYPTTGWRTIISAKENDFAALERLVTRYRPPIIREIASRAKGGAADAEELTQEFITVWLRRNFLKNVEPRKGRFRSFVKECIRRFLIDIHRHKTTLPDIGSLDATDDEGRRILDPPAESVALDEALDAKWAQYVVTLALAKLERELSDARWGAYFSRLQPFLLNTTDDSLKDTARDLGVDYGALRTAISRMRERLGEILREEIRENVGEDEDWEEEKGYYIKLLGGNFPVT